MSAQVPRVAWYARQREASLGLESMLYAYIAIGSALILILHHALNYKDKPNPN
jgi:hypothetical protein